MSVSWVRVVLSGLVLLVYWLANTFWSSLYSQYQGVLSAQSLNADGMFENAMLVFLRHNDIVGAVMLVLLIIVLLIIWYVPISNALYQAGNKD